MKLTIYIIIAVVVCALVGGAYWLWARGTAPTQDQQTVQAITQAPSLPSVVTPQNPVTQSLPNTNPVSQTNPFTYNPFNQ
ncbi:MAG: hypothetical protein KGI60_00910 [Patescibacteria group bacterium]|nr:hypothetical protein [Patescibacteria group bacterium]